jgi:thiol-disulfide isomerase/thioredoxin
LFYTTTQEMRRDRNDNSLSFQDNMMDNRDEISESQINTKPIMDNSNPQSVESNTQTEPPSSNSTSQTIVQSVGEYKPYSEDLVRNASPDQNIILFFNASWCPTCRVAVRNIEANLDQIDPNVLILSVDYDDNTSLRRQYGVTYQHTFVQVNSNGDFIKRDQGFNTVDQINNFAK